MMIGRRRSLVEEFSDLEAADAIEDELIALKKRLAKSGSSEGTVLTHGHS